MGQLSARLLLKTETVTIQDVVCRGECRHKSPEEFSRCTHLVFPYRGVYVRHLGSDDAVAETNQLLFFNQGEGCRVSHPVSGAGGRAPAQPDAEHRGNAGSRNLGADAGAARRGSTDLARGRGQPGPAEAGRPRQVGAGFGSGSALDSGGHCRRGQHGVRAVPDHHRIALADVDETNLELLRLEGRTRDEREEEKKDPAEPHAPV